MPKLLVFAGSTRAQSFNRRLAHATAEIARAAGAQVTLLELSDYDIPVYNADLEAAGTPPDVLRLKEVLDAHPAWIICSSARLGRALGSRRRAKSAISAKRRSLRSATSPVTACPPTPFSAASA